MSKRVKIEGIKGETLDLSGWYENQKNKIYIDPHCLNLYKAP